MTAITPTTLTTKTSASGRPRAILLTHTTTAAVLSANAVPAWPRVPRSRLRRRGRGDRRAQGHPSRRVTARHG